MKSFPFYRQYDAMDCGPTCLQMVAKHYGKYYNIESLRKSSFISREGVSLLGISRAAESIGFRTVGVHISFEKLCDVPLPCIVHWNQNHFVVVYRIKRNRKNSAKYTIYVADPAAGRIKYTNREFLSSWLSTKNENNDEGIALLLEPTPDFYNGSGEKHDKTRLSFAFSYLMPYKRLVVQLFLGMLLGTAFQLVFPILSQSIVDYGIGNSDVSFVVLVLIAQLTLGLAQIAVEFIRSWILLHISTRININILSDFLIKLMKLPISFFDTKMIGDIIQRIGDHNRIETFLTSTTLNTLFSFINLVVFGMLLSLYSIKIFIIFLIASVLYILWIWLFLKKRKDLDNKRFAQSSAEQSNLYQLITGMQEIKLNNCEQQKRWEWENIQARLFKLNIKGLALQQYQQSGAFFINETKNILISFISAISVINGDITMGMMMAVQYIIGTLNSPINQMIGFVHSAQDAKISLERLGEIHNRPDEETSEHTAVSSIPDHADISISNLTFYYDPLSFPVLKDINISIPESKVTAIVGESGSGKTTLLKLILGVYHPQHGNIMIGDRPLKSVNCHDWRSKCGTVMQDGFIFSDTIAQNIAMTGENIDLDKLLHATSVANLEDLIAQQPLGYNTRIGQEGIGLSQGQKQRILIARTVYKNPDFIFLDEATNSLDANNELEIMNNLHLFFKNKTVIVVAHRLSTVRNADQIIALHHGSIVEQGTHIQLIALKGYYYNLVKNQLIMEQ